VTTQLQLINIIIIITIIIINIIKTSGIANNCNVKIQNFRDRHSKTITVYIYCVFLTYIFFKFIIMIKKHQLNSQVFIMKCNSSWQGVPQHREVRQNVA
jgi:hypothetical protein